MNMPTILKNNWPWIIIGGGIVIILLLILLIIPKAKPSPLRPELEKFILKMHPEAQDRFREFVRDVEKDTGWIVEIASGHRGFLQAERIFNTIPAVRACCPLGTDWHFYGLALDIVLHKDNQRLGLAASRAAWEATGIRKIAKKHCLRWGIDFNGYYDPVHFDFPAYNLNNAGGLVADLRAKYGSQFPSIIGDNGNKINLQKYKLTGKAKCGWSNCENTLTRQVC